MRESINTRRGSSDGEGRRAPTYQESRDALLMTLGGIRSLLTEEEFAELNGHVRDVLAFGAEGERMKEDKRGLSVDDGGEMGLAGWADH